MHATSAGKVFMAHIDPCNSTLSWRRAWKPTHRHTIVDPSAPKQQLALVRERGYACTMEEHEIGLAAIGAPYAPWTAT